MEDIYFFEVNTKYISSSVLKTSEFSRVRSFQLRSIFFFILYFLWATCNVSPTVKGC